jgi:Fe-S cluster biosynthesis and repair protein YggX
LAVLGFWSRQFAVLVYPALVASRLHPWWRAGLYARRRELAAAAVGTLLVGAGVLGYFAWARATGNYKPQFAKPMAALTTFSATLWLIQSSVLLAYMSASFVPLLLLSRTHGGQRARWVVGAACAAFMMAGWVALQTTGGHGFDPDRPLNARFPFAGNVIYPTGLGPVTLTDVYVQELGTRPNWKSDTPWLCIEYVLLLCTALWGLIVSTGSARDVARASPASRLGAGNTGGARNTSGARSELCWFAAAWLFGSFMLSVQAYQRDVMDRYYFPCILALGLLVPARLALVRAEYAGLRLRTLLALGTGLSLAWFAIAGEHDYLRWQQVRLGLYQQALARGVSPASIDAGYELNGWHNVKPVHTPTCIGTCRCPKLSWYCKDSSYRILMSGVPRGYELVKQVQPSYWLADGPPLSLVRRRPRRPRLDASRGSHHIRRMSRTVHCVKLGHEAEGLEKPPIKGELGQRVFENVSKEGWKQWIAHSTMLINELRLDFNDPKAQKVWLTECEKFFFGEGSAAPEGFVPPKQ